MSPVTSIPEVVWKEGRSFKPEAATVYARITSLAADTSDGICSPQMLVDSARSEEDDLHEAFEWDDFRAAESHRRQQARWLIGSIRIVDDGQPSGAPAFVHVKVVDENGGSEGYVDTATLRTNDEMRAFAIAEARKYLSGARKRYGHLNELTKVWDAIDSELEEAA